MISERDFSGKTKMISVRVASVSASPPRFRVLRAGCGVGMNSNILILNINKIQGVGHCISKVLTDFFRYGRKSLFRRKWASDEGGEAKAYRSSNAAILQKNVVG